jgi:hypothetical protein
MKKLFILLFVFLPVAILAQVTGKYSFYVQGGYLSSGYVHEAFQNSIVSKKESHNHKCIILNAGFQMEVAEKWRLGPSFTYDHFGTKRRSVEYSTLSYLLRADRVWKETKTYWLYSGFALGIKSQKHFENETLVDHKLNPACHIYVTGFRLQVDHFSLDANLGWGVCGLFNLGVHIPL